MCLLHIIICIDISFNALPAAVQNIVGLVLVKELLLVDEQAGVRVSQLRLRELPFIRWAVGGRLGGWEGGWPRVACVACVTCVAGAHSLYLACQPARRPALLSCHR